MKGRKVMDLEHHASAGNRTRVTSMATMYSATRPLMQRNTHGLTYKVPALRRAELQKVTPSQQAVLEPLLGATARCWEGMPPPLTDMTGPPPSIKNNRGGEGEKSKKVSAGTPN